MPLLLFSNNIFALPITGDTDDSKLNDTALHCIAVFVSKLCAMYSFTCSSEVQWSTKVTVWNFGSYRYFNTAYRLCLSIVKRFESSSSIETSLVACPSVKYSDCNPKKYHNYVSIFSSVCTVQSTASAQGDTSL